MIMYTMMTRIKEKGMTPTVAVPVKVTPFRETGYGCCTGDQKSKTTQNILHTQRCDEGMGKMQLRQAGCR